MFVFGHSFYHEPTTICCIHKPSNKTVRTQSELHQNVANAEQHRGTYYDVVSGSEITSCNKIDKPLVVNRFSGNVMTYITALLTL